MAKLFEPISIRGVTSRNRIWIAPMCMYSCENKDGVVNNWHLVHLGSRASGGAGLVMAEATAIRPDGRISPWDAGIWNDEQVKAWQPVTEFIRSQGSLAAIQLAHAGRKASIYRSWSGDNSVAVSDGGWESVSSTSEAFPGYAAPRELSTAEVRELIGQWVQAAINSVKAGFDVIEIHAAHGYLVHQFLSPLTNQRTDEFGGSKENRARFLIEIVRGMRAAIGENVPLLVRFSATDYHESGFTVEDCSEVARWAHEAGADLFDISSGGLITGVKIPVGPGYQVPLSQEVSESVEAPVSAVGLITDAKQAEEILQTTDIDIIMIARLSLRDPYWPLRAASELGVEVDYWPLQYVRGKYPSN
jgi:2,4-dienoyl-CoA reductase-like NADH-dependent reductase (Old Yellow Enzyme family)